MTKVMGGDSPDEARPRSTVYTRLPRLSTFFGACRRRFAAGLSSSEIRGNALQYLGLASTGTGVFMIFGLGVGLVTCGLTVAYLGVLHEAGRF